jgi:hypothetical protein
MPPWLKTGSSLRALLRTPGMLQVAGIAVLVIFSEVVAVGILTGAFSRHGSAGPQNAGPRLAKLTEANPHARPRHAAGAAAVTIAPATHAAAAPRPAPTPAPAPVVATPPARHVTHSQPKRRFRSPAPKSRLHNPAPHSPTRPAPTQPPPSSTHFRHHRERQAPAPGADPSPQPWQRDSGGQDHQGDGGGDHQGDGGGDRHRGDFGGSAGD